MPDYVEAKREHRLNTQYVGWHAQIINGVFCRDRRAAFFNHRFHLSQTPLKNNLSIRHWATRKYESMTRFDHQRHKPPTELSQPRPLVLVCPQLKSNINFSRIVRAASCCGVTQMVTSGTGKVDATIARDGVEQVEISVRRSLGPVLKKLSTQGLRLVGLEQTTNSKVLYDYRFVRESALVIGHERNGISPELLSLLDDVIEIPVFGLPYSYNVATATSMALYEYCRQFPTG